MNKIEIKTFTHPDFGSVRCFQEEGEVKFIGVDLAIFLGYSTKKQEHYAVLRKHCPNIVKRVVNIGRTFAPALIISNADAVTLVYNTTTPRGGECHLWLNEKGLLQIDTPIEPEIVEEVTEAEPMLPEVTDFNDSGFKFFENSELGKIRVVLKDNEPLFILKDLCDCLGLGNPSKVASNLEEDEKDDITISDTIGRKQILLGVYESGLYSVIARSNKKIGQKLRRWIFHEVLPSIRQHGMYATDNLLEKATSDPDFIIGIMTKMKEERELRRIAEQERDETKKRFGQIQSKEIKTAYYTARTANFKAKKAEAELATFKERYDLVVEDRNTVSIENGILKKENSKLQNENSKLLNENFILGVKNEDLNEQIGNGKNYKTASYFIDNHKQFFDMKAVRNGNGGCTIMVANQLQNISNQLGLENGEPIHRPKYDEKTYHIQAHAILETMCIKDENLFGKYRKHG